MNILKQMTMVMVLAAGTVGLAQAHHAVNSQFDSTQTLKFTGVLARVESGNPHGYLYFVRTMPNGQTQNWTFETDAIVALRRAGLSVRDDLKVGTIFSLAYFPSLDGTQAGQMTAIKLTSGRIIAFSEKDAVEQASKALNEKLLGGTESNQQ